MNPRKQLMPRIKGQRYQKIAWGLGETLTVLTVDINFRSGNDIEYARTAIPLLTRMMRSQQKSFFNEGITS